MGKITSIDIVSLEERFLVLAKIHSDQKTLKCCKSYALSTAIVFAKVKNL